MGSDGSGWVRGERSEVGGQRAEFTEDREGNGEGPRWEFRGNWMRLLTVACGLPVFTCVYLCLPGVGTAGTRTKRPKDLRTKGPRTEGGGQKSEVGSQRTEQRRGAEIFFSGSPPR